MTTIGWSDFALKHSQQGSGNSYTTLSPEAVVKEVIASWHKRIPGSGETGIDRKVLVPLDSGHCFFCPPRMPLQKDMPIQARVVERQEGEDPFIETFITRDDAEALGFKPTPAKSVQIVCYSAEALEENGGHRSTDCEFEIVTILANSNAAQEPMPSLTMARNYLEKEGGTFTDYTAKEFAEAIYYHSCKSGVKVIDP